MNLARNFRPRRGFTAVRTRIVLWLRVTATMFLQVTMGFTGVASGSLVSIVLVSSPASASINGNKRFPVSAGELYGFVLFAMRICQPVKLFRHFGSLCLSIRCGPLCDAVATRCCALLQ